MPSESDYSYRVGYVVFDFENGQNDNATLWWNDEYPDYNINFWEVADEWIVVGFE